MIHSQPSLDLGAHSTEKAGPVPVPAHSHTKVDLFEGTKILKHAQPPKPNDKPTSGEFTMSHYI